MLQAVAFFTSKIDKLEPKPLSSEAVMELVIQSSKAWNNSQLRVGVCLDVLSPPSAASNCWQFPYVL